ncbi:MAG: TldD/PmbA family protein [Candidatus Brockarchaeota archaeon]|nr:TldD/PmbA family protein [Candidatus Brockarchaeota archaeon]
MEDFSWVLENIPAKYSDVRILRHRFVHFALRTDSSDFFQEEWSRVICRVISNGYGVASTDKLDRSSVERVALLALRNARLCRQSIELVDVNSEKGFVEHPVIEEFEAEKVLGLLKFLDGEIRAKTSFPIRTELIASHCQIDSTLITSEGSEIREKTPLTDLTIYIFSRGLAQGFSSKIIGGMGGLEALRNQQWEEIVEDLVRRASDSTRAKPSISLHFTYPYLTGRFKVILDPEAAGGFAHEIAHFLEADVYQERFFKGLNYGIKLIDNPLLEGAYGSFYWDDEGVRSKEKILLGKNGITLLHTRLTAKKGSDAGNARGILHKPRPMASNVYIGPSDWSKEEIFADTQNGIYAEGLVRAECKIDEGRIEIEPEIAYVLKSKELTTPIRNLKIICSIKDISRIDAVGTSIQLRPSYEKGFAMSEGAPYLRINGAICR